MNRANLTAGLVLSLYLSGCGGPAALGRQTVATTDLDELSQGLDEQFPGNWVDLDSRASEAPPVSCGSDSDCCARFHRDPFSGDHCEGVKDDSGDHCEGVKDDE